MARAIMKASITRVFQMARRQGRPKIEAGRIWNYLELP